MGAGFARLDLDEVSVGVGGSVNSIRQEIDDAYADCRTFPNRDPDECIRLVQGHYARMAEIRSRIVRVEDWERHWKAIRDREVEPLLKELTLLWETASRRHTIRIDEYKIETGDK